MTSATSCVMRVSSTRLTSTTRQSCLTGSCGRSASKASSTRLPARTSEAAYLLWNTATPFGIAALNAEVSRQASIIAYADDFKFLFVLTLSWAVLVLFMQPSATAQGDSHAAAMH